MKVAIKKQSNRICIDEAKYIKEVDCLMKVRHANIVRFLGYCSDTQGEWLKYEGKGVMAEVRQRLLCFEFLHKGSLARYITGRAVCFEYLCVIFVTYYVRNLRLEC